MKAHGGLRRRSAALIALILVAVAVPVALVAVATMDPGAWTDERADGASVGARVDDDASPSLSTIDRTRHASEAVRSPRRDEPIEPGDPSRGFVTANHVDPDSTIVAAPPVSPAANAVATDTAVEATAVAKSPRVSTRIGGAGASRTLPDVPPKTLLVLVRPAEKETKTTIDDATVEVFAPDGVARRARADFQGRATFTVPGGVTVDVEAKSPGRVRRRIDGVVVPDALVPVEIALERGVVVQGTVEGPKGLIAKATVTAFASEPYRKVLPYDPDPRPIETTTTDKRGRYRLDCIPRGVACSLVFEADGFAPTYDDVEKQPDADYVVRLDTKLERGFALDGIVQDAKGKPVEGASVFAFAWLGPRSMIKAPSRIPELDWNEFSLLDEIRDAITDEGVRPERVRTGPDGRFHHVLPVEWDEPILLAMHPSLGRSTYQKSGLAGSLATLTVRGRVKAEFALWTSNNAPAENETIVPYLPWERWNVAARKPGRYGIADVDDGPILMRISGEAGAPGDYIGHRTDHELTIWRVDLRRSDVWKGQVHDDRKLPVGGATVIAGERHAVTDEDGRFEVTGVDPLLRYVTVTAPGHWSVEEKYVQPLGRERIEIELPRFASLRFWLRLPTDAPAPTWRRVWSSSKDGHSVLPPDEFDWKDGRVDIAERSPRDDRVVVFVPGYEVAVLSADAEPAVPLDLGDIHLVPVRQLRGTVVDESGEPVPGAEVLLRIGGDAPWREIVPDRPVTADAKGEFAIDRVAPTERFELIAAADDFATTPQAFPALVADPPRVVIGRLRTFRGKAKPPTKDMLIGAHLLGLHGETYVAVRLEPDGSFEAEVPLRPRTVEIVDVSNGRVIRSVPIPDTWVETDVFELPK